MSQPNPSADVVRAARAYLAALLPAGEVADAWHDVLGDVRYWAETDLASVLKIAHGVVQQRQRATEDARYLALTQDAGVSDRSVLAEILGVDEVRLAAMDTAMVQAITEPVVIPEAVPAVAPPASGQAPPAVALTEAGDIPAPAVAPDVAAPATPSSPVEPASEVGAKELAAATAPNGTIRFHAEAGSLDPISELQRKVDTPLDQQRRIPGRTLLGWVVAIWAVVVVLIVVVR